MRAYAIAIFLSLTFVSVMLLSFSFFAENWSMRENKSSSWKEYLYYGSNKGYTRTKGFDFDTLTLEDLYGNDMSELTGNITFDMLYYEAVKDISLDYLYKDNETTFGIGIKGSEWNVEDVTAGTGYGYTPLTFYVRRYDEGEDVTNVMKMELKKHNPTDSSEIITPDQEKRAKFCTYTKGNPVDFTSYFEKYASSGHSYVNSNLTGNNDTDSFHPMTGVYGEFITSMETVNSNCNVS